jgi:hypothetical protein
MIMVLRRRSARFVRENLMIAAKSVPVTVDHEVLRAICPIRSP